jgi:hypothetical protein
MREVSSWRKLQNFWDLTHRPMPVDHKGVTCGNMTTLLNSSTIERASAVEVS